MTRQDLALEVAKQTGMHRDKAERLVVAFCDSVAEALSKGQKVVYSNFGTFYALKYPSKVITHPKWRDRQIVMPQTNVIKWMPSGNIKTLAKTGEAKESPTTHGAKLNNAVKPTSKPIDLNNIPPHAKYGPDVDPPHIFTIAKTPPTASSIATPENKKEVPVNVRVVKSTPNISISEPIIKVAPTVAADEHLPEVKPADIFEESDAGGEKEVSTINGAIRVHKKPSFFNRIFGGRNDIDTTEDPIEEKSKISLANAGIFSAQKQEIPNNVSLQPPAPPALDGNASTFEHIGKIKRELHEAAKHNITPMNTFAATATNIAYIDLSQITIPKEILQRFPEKLARKYKTVPVSEDEHKLVVAMVDPEDIEAKELIKKYINKNLDVKLATEADINHILDQYQTLESEVKEAIGVKTVEQIPASEEKNIVIESASNNAPAARIVSSLLRRAIRDKASDIHIEPSEGEVDVRFRIDGVLQKKISLPKDVQQAVISRIKILCNMKIDEQRLPQDGRFSIDLDERRVDFRVSTMPVAYGEKMVMRILDKMTGILTVEQLGVGGSGLATLNGNTDKAHGMILVTGPTGSGKTTTLYALIDRLYNEGVNIVTLEDPIEYRMPGINQSQVNADIKYTFASGLRSIVRQDPDIIMIGEIRDGETADMAVHSALTGHIVLSTLHTNDAAGAIPRMVDMGVEPFLLTSTINVIIGQRLARKICDKCRVEETIPPEEIKKVQDEIGMMPEKEKAACMAKPLKFYKGKGCKACNDTGYKGRVGLYEVLSMSEPIKQLVLAKKQSSDIQVEATKEGMVTMLQDGLIKALTGQTSLEEIWRVTKE